MTNAEIQKFNHNSNLSLNNSILDYSTVDGFTLMMEKSQALQLYQLNCEKSNNLMTIKDLKKQIEDKKLQLESQTE